MARWQSREFAISRASAHGAHPAAWGTVFCVDTLAGPAYHASGSRPFFVSLAGIVLMIARVRLLLTMLFAAGYLAQALVLGVIHLHTGDDSNCDGQTNGCLATEEWSPCEHSHGGCHGSHECLPSDSRDDHGHRRSPAHNHENCSICHHLVAQSISTESVRSPLVGEAVELVESARPIFHQVAQPRIHFSRGPPAQCC